MNIKLIILDVDGTLTDGGIYYDSCGQELKKFNVKDGLAIKVAISAGIEFAILTGRQSAIVERRAEELGIKYLQEGVQDKYTAMIELIRELKLELKNVGYIGDDWNDLQAMKEVAVKGCPSDAAAEVKEICDIIAEHQGGQGAVRDCIQKILEFTGSWTESAIKTYFI